MNEASNFREDHTPKVGDSGSGVTVRTRRLTESEMKDVRKILKRLGFEPPAK